VKTTTILNAYIRARDKRFFNWPKRENQAVKFRAALLARIEAGDRAREVLKEIGSYQIYGDTTGDELITLAVEFLEAK